MRYRRIDAQNRGAGRLALQRVSTPVDESGRSRKQGVGCLVCEKNCVTSHPGELFDAGRNVDGVADQGELRLPATAADEVPAITTPVLMPMPIRSAPPNLSATRR